ncbi:MAG: glycosyltransferase [Bacteroidetes bacterium HGW-Bacteroidetes-21]|jgi:glycosyltransferase involved in cell wall biosynthesis|nr:MAG: glycosyltransferase [Bacteroidetes bacterium HGW-Bacteroidetes-21]
MQLSIVIPLFNEEESLPELSSWIHDVCQKHNYSYEIIFVDDGSNDNSWKVIQDLSATNKNIKALRFRRNYGKSAGLYCGFEVAQGDVVLTMDADLQDSPDEIPGLYKMITEEGYDLVSGWKQKRYDPFMKTFPSKFFNWTARRVSKIKLHDFNCGLKAYRKEVIKSIEVYGEMHRYIPILAKRAGFAKIGEKVVMHQSRKYGVSKFGLERFVNGFLDLLSLSFISRFGKRPMHFFGVWGTLMFLIGGGVALYLLIEKVVKSLNNTPLRDVTDQPLFYLALLAIILGVQLFLAGFLGELISRNGSDRNKYMISEEI